MLEILRKEGIKYREHMARKMDLEEKDSRRDVELR